MKNSFDPIPFLGAFIDGRFRDASRGKVLSSEDPGDLSRPVGRFRSHPPAVAAAVDAARRAFAPWRALSLDDRTACLRRFQAALSARADELAFVISRETGKPLSESRGEAASMAAKVDVTVKDGLALLAERSSLQADGTVARTLYKPLGVIGVIGPFNVPGHLPNGQIVPALLCGNTVVFKPSEQTPFTGQLTAEIWAEAGLPAGVFNMVQGDGAVGAALAEHPGVDALFFTGSVPTGRRVARACAADPAKLVALELGGKNAALVLPDAPMEAAVKEISQGAFATAGQRCSCTSRVLVHKDAAAAFLKAFLPAVDAVTVGYFPSDPAMGPLIDGAAAARFLAAQKTARRLGYETLREGRAVKAERRGHYVSPSVHAWEGMPRFRKPDYWDEELFAPDAAVYILKDEEEMTALHNASRFGLAAAVFTASRERFDALRGRLDAGVIHWNRSTAMTPGVLPFGGVKASGNHRPAGLHAILHCVTPVGSIERPLA